MRKVRENFDYDPDYDSGNDYLYGQPTGEQGYNPTFDDRGHPTAFSMWMPAVKAKPNGKVEFPFPGTGGYKVHLSVAFEDADRVARKVLPILQEMKVPHKVVRSLDRYQEMDSGEHKGKFITIFVGPFLDSFFALLKRLEPVLEEMKAKRGAIAMVRKGGHCEAEQRARNSPLLTQVFVDDYDT
jgi:hypothetical protein